MIQKKISRISASLLLSSLSLFAIDSNNGAKVLDTKCSACHTGSVKDGLSRISDQRKTPEGWYMTINRMQRIHGLSITKEEEQDVVKYLSDNQGLTPDEIKPYTYVLDKTPNYQKPEVENELFDEMCVRCHSQARVGLQRRTAKEWDGLVNFHVGQFISFEAQAQARDRDWFKIAQEKIVPYLEKTYGKNEKVWQDYKDSMKNYFMPLSWNFYGHDAINGDFSATLILTKTANESYDAKYVAEYENGKKLETKGVAILYSGSELRVSLVDANSKRYQQILHLEPKSYTAKGRIFETLHNELGATLNGVSTNNAKTIITGVYPRAIKAGKKAQLIITGSNLVSKLALPVALKVEKVVSNTGNKLVLDVVAASELNGAKQIDISVNDINSKNAVVVYDKIDFVKVTPDYAIARDGGFDHVDSILKEYAAFEALGFSAGKDGKEGTEDDINLGKVPVTWNMKAFDEQAEEDKDVAYAGSINRYTGLFTPSEAGPNVERKLMANNVGNLTITATYFNNGEKLVGESHLVVAVPKFINPPIN